MNEIFANAERSEECTCNRTSHKSWTVLRTHFPTGVYAELREAVKIRDHISCKIQRIPVKVHIIAKVHIRHTRLWLNVLIKSHVGQ
ncbi:hypothetical protein SAMN04489735_101857 [Aneurinibacillus thermoaerophilus]|uniref:Uncharacterized protein n=1 Tax=Aneurinibacillus thermoaerophilus TaxID=143495 RepID=A0A1G8AWS4_ANETH|nr:hypothetical protein ACH33_08025 [Aneurinibacillus sp. XH2]SDH25253.1 hypothetical protein SAMN04489735_101857 [Aneurinibacillus thermoaerophilus]